MFSFFFLGRVHTNCDASQASEREVALKQELETKVVAAEDRVLQRLGRRAGMGRAQSMEVDQRKTGWDFFFGSFESNNDDFLGGDFGARIGGWGCLGAKVS